MWLINYWDQNQRNGFARREQNYLQMFRCRIRPKTYHHRLILPNCWLQQLKFCGKLLKILEWKRCTGQFCKNVTEIAKKQTVFCLIWPQMTLFDLKMAFFFTKKRHFDKTPLYRFVILSGLSTPNVDKEMPRNFDLCSIRFFIKNLKRVREGRVTNREWI